jgi:PAS domain S-box-containing protein
MTIPAPQHDDPRTDGSSRRDSIRIALQLVLTSGVIFLLDVFTRPSVDIPILYMCVLLLCLRCSWRPAPFVAAGTALVLIAIPPALFWSAPLDWSIVVNRAITAAALGLTARLVANRCVAEAAVQESQVQLGRRVEERTAQWRAANQALEAEVAVRRETERSLHESLERLARTEAFSRVMVTHVGLDGRWLKVPAPLCRLLGYSEAELLADRFMTVTHPEDVEADWSQCQRLIRGEIKSFELEKRYIRRDGTVVWVYLNCCGVYDQGGRLLHFLTYIRDIDDRKQAEGAMRESEAKWRRVMETLPIGIALSTAEGRVLDVNTAAWTILGYESKEQLLQDPGSPCMDPEDRRRRIAAVRAGRHVFETPYKRKDGSLFWGRCTSAIFGEGGDLVLIDAYEDITEQRGNRDTLERAKQELQSANQRLTERDEIRTRFLSVVSHELRTPMAAIKGFVDNMLSGVTGEVTDQQTTYLTRIRSNIDRLTRLIAQILDWSRLETGGLQLVRVSVSPASVVRAVCDNAQTLASAKSILLSTHVEPDLPAVQADADKLEQVLWNLIGNAVKFTPAHGQITVECRRVDDAVQFVIGDSGCGIAPEELPRVFDQFSGVNSPAASARGAQLGLYITKRLVALHGGRVRVESVLGEGSRFFAEFPIAGNQPL